QAEQREQHADGEPQPGRGADELMCAGADRQAGRREGQREPGGERGPGGQGTQQPFGEGGAGPGGRGVCEVCGQQREPARVDRRQQPGRERESEQRVAHDTASTAAKILAWLGLTARNLTWPAESTTSTVLSAVTWYLPDRTAFWSTTVGR